MKRILSMVTLFIFATIVFSSSIFANENLSTSNRNANLQKYKNNMILKTKAGAKGIVLKETVKRVARKLRSSEMEKVAQVIESFRGKESANVLRKYSGKIANKLDYIATWEDCTGEIVQNQITELLKGLGIRSNIAFDVGYVLKLIIDWGLL
jgi:hypothetical protein